MTIVDQFELRLVHKMFYKVLIKNVGALESVEQKEIKLLQQPSKCGYCYCHQLCFILLPGGCWVALFRVVCSRLFSSPFPNNLNQVTSARLPDTIGYK